MTSLGKGDRIVFAGGVGMGGHGNRSFQVREGGIEAESTGTHVLDNGLFGGNMES